MKIVEKDYETSMVILATDENIVEPVSVRGWKDRHGKIHMSEYFARLASATHSKCQSCDALYPLSSYTICTSCREKKSIEKYNCMPYREWDGITPLYSDLANRYFMNADEICDYCYDNEIDISTLRLKICEPNKYREVQDDYWSDEMPEDQEELDEELVEALERLNEVIRSLPVLSWSESIYRTSYNCTPATDTIVE